MAGERQIVANHLNGKLGGPTTEEGKAVSRLNARKHGIFACAVTEHDAPELHALLGEFAEWLKPAGPVETMLVEKLAVTYLQLQRCVRAEARYHEWTWEPYQRKDSGGGKRPEPDTAPYFRARFFERSVELFARYDTTLTNRLAQLLHEVERTQRMRAGEGVLAPIVAEVSVHADSEASGQTPPPPRNEGNAS